MDKVMQLLHRELEQERALRFKFETEAQANGECICLQSAHDAGLFADLPIAMQCCSISLMLARACHASLRCMVAWQTEAHHSVCQSMSTISGIILHSAIDTFKFSASSRHLETDGCSTCACAIGHAFALLSASQHFAWPQHAYSCSSLTSLQLHACHLVGSSAPGSPSPRNQKLLCESQICCLQRGLRMV